MRKDVSIVCKTFQFSPTFSQYTCFSHFIKEFFNDLNSYSPFSPYILQLETEPALQAEFTSELCKSSVGHKSFIPPTFLMHRNALEFILCWFSSRVFYKVSASFLDTSVHETHTCCTFLTNRWMDTAIRTCRRSIKRTNFARFKHIAIWTAVVAR